MEWKIIILNNQKLILKNIVYINFMVFDVIQIIVGQYISHNISLMVI